MLKRVWRKRTLLQCWWDCKWEQPLWRTVRRFFEKLKIELPYDPPVPLLDIYLEKNIIQKHICTLKFILSLFTVDKAWKQPKCPSTDEWIKMWCIYIYTHTWENQFSSVQFSHSVVSSSLWPHGLQHTRLPCPSPTPGACSNSCA